MNSLEVFDALNAGFVNGLSAIGDRRREQSSLSAGWRAYNDLVIKYNARADEVNGLRTLAQHYRSHYDQMKAGVDVLTALLKVETAKVESLKRRVWTIT